MADREYKIELKIQGDASGTAPVDSGLKAVAEGAKKTTEALKEVEDQSRRTQEATNRPAGGAGGSLGAAFGVGANGLPLPDKPRAWHSPEEVAYIEKMAAGMGKLSEEATTMDGAVVRAAAGFGTLGTAAIVAGGGIVAVLAPIIAGAMPEIRAMGASVADLGARFSRAASEAVGLPDAVQGITSAIKNYSGASADERAEEQRTSNAKMDATLVRNQAARAALEEKEAVEAVTSALAAERQALEMRQAVDVDRSRTGQVTEAAQFDLERAKLTNTPGISREERATRDADIERRQIEARQARQKSDIERRLQDEMERVAVADMALEDAQKRGDPTAIAKAQAEEVSTRNSASAARLRANGDRDRLASTGPLELSAQGERAQAAIVSARETDSQEMASEMSEGVREYMQRTGEKNRFVAKQKKDAERAAAEEEKERMRGLQARFQSSGGALAFDGPGVATFGQAALGGAAVLRNAIGRNQMGAAQTGETTALIGKLEAAASSLADGSSTPEEARAFADALTKLASAIQKVSPTFAEGLRGIRAEVEPRLKQIEADLSTLQAMGTR